MQGHLNPSQNKNGAGLFRAGETPSAGFDSIRFKFLNKLHLRRRGSQPPLRLEREAIIAHAASHQASASYTLVSIPTTRFIQQAWQRNRIQLPTLSGPVTLLLGLLAVFLAFLLTVRSLIVRKVRACKCCRGYGIKRCALCNGKGSVGWKAKLSYQEPCPLCMTKRFVSCPDCGGYHHRHMFSHIGGRGVGFTNG